MKKVLIAFIIIGVCFGFAACGQAGGKTGNVEVIIGDSVRFDREEIVRAADSVIKEFADFKGCELTQLWYDEAISDFTIDGYVESGSGSVNGVGKENVIVLLSNFDVDSSGGDGSFNPNSTYTDWNWIVIRDSENEDWYIKDWGY